MINNNHINFRDRDLVFVDTETTGMELNHEIIEIGLVRVSGYNFSVLEELEIKIKPRRLEIADQESLRIAHYSEEDWKDAKEPEDALKIFLQKTEGAILAGHNLLFDWYYINKALAEYNLKPTFWYKGLDTVSLAWQKLRQNPGIKSFGLKELAAYFEIEQEKPHSALDDAKTAYRVFMKLSKL
ncbi:3'-5' exonuclease [Candidatus Wolfebacteria bacterium]|nr:3'-5' exonuclease [Candidatus Wolfebacteria bacterium]